MSFEDAQAQQQAWETQRIQGAAALRPKITHLLQSQLREAEAAFEIIKGENFTLMDAVKYRLDHKPAAAHPVIEFQDALQAFLDDVQPHVGKAQYENYRQRGSRFGEFIGPDTDIRQVSDKMMTEWLASIRTPAGKPIKKKTWNNLFGDVSALFAFLVRRDFLAKHPFTSLKRYSKRALGAGARKRLNVEKCRDLMSYLEKEYPEWCCYFSITLFAGVRPDLRNGEMWELARCVDRDGIENYYSNGKLHLTAEITKEGEPRQTTVPANLAAWLKKYPPTSKAICPGDPKECTPIRKFHKLPHDGLRHTAISAFMSRTGANGYDRAADEFGNSEPIIKRHYLQRMSAEEAKAFYEIMPSAALA